MPPLMVVIVQGIGLNIVHCRESPLSAIATALCSKPKVLGAPTIATDDVLERAVEGCMLVQVVCASRSCAGKGIGLRASEDGCFVLAKHRQNVPGVCCCEEFGPGLSEPSLIGAARMPLAIEVSLGASTSAHSMKFSSPARARRARYRYPSA